MVTYLLKMILHRSLSIPLIWGMVYPGLFSSIVVRDLRLESPVLSSVSWVRVEKTEVDLRWKSLLEDVIEIPRARLYGLDIQIDLRDPQRVLYCLQDRLCRTPKQRMESRARLAADSGAKRERAQAKEKRRSKPLQFSVQAFEIRSGTIAVKRGDKRLLLEIARGVGSSAFIPLRPGVSKLEVDAYVRLEHEDNGSIPLRLKIENRALPENGSEQQLQIEIFTEGLPLSYLELLFPELHFAGVGQISGRLSGRIGLEYRDSSGWSLG